MLIAAFVWLTHSITFTLATFLWERKILLLFLYKWRMIGRESKWLEPLSPEFLLCSWMRSSITFFTCWQVENNNSLYSASQPELFILHEKLQQTQPHKPLLTWRGGCWFSFVINFSALKIRNSVKACISKADENRVWITETEVLITVCIPRVTNR